jgi:hypothetical protein
MSDMQQDPDLNATARTHSDDAILAAVLTVYTEAELTAMSTSMLLSMVRFLDRRLTRRGHGPTARELRDLRELLTDQFSLPARRDRVRMP